MAVATFDTHTFVKRLTAAGMPEAQAEVLADEQRKLIEERLATSADILTLEQTIEDVRAELKRDIENLRAELKRDIEDLRIELKRDIAELRTELKRDMKELEQRLTIRLGLMLAASIGLIAALVGFSG